MKTIILPAKTEALYRALDFVKEAARESGGAACPMQLELAVEEIFVNIASYAYDGQGGQAELRCERKPGLLIVEFRDQGKPYDPMSQPEPDLACPAEQRPIGGLGVHLVKECADTIAYRYEDNTNVLTLGIRLKGGEHEND